jgi:cell division ATPase FtsA
MNFLRRFYQRRKRQPTAYSLIDIGRDTIKAVVVLLKPETGSLEVVGHGLAETGPSDITGGRLEATAVTSQVNIALTLAEDSTEAVVGHKIVPDDVIFAVAGRATIGKLFTVRQSRPQPGKPISAKELNQLKQRAERNVFQGVSQGDDQKRKWRPLAVNDVGLRLDSHLILNGVGLTGQELTFSIFGVAVQVSAWRALEVLANQLDLTLANMIASPQALASIVPQTEAILLDTGASGTTLCLIRDNALVAADWVPFGGDYFTQTLARALDIRPGEAKTLKHALSAGGLSEDEVDYLNNELDPARHRWYEAVMEALLRQAAGKALPWRIFLTGGGNLLPALGFLFQADPTYFDRVPDVSRLGAPAFTGLKISSQDLDYDRFALALSLTVGVPHG